MVYDLITDWLPNETKIHCVKYLTKSVFFNNKSITKFTEYPPGQK